MTSTTRISKCKSCGALITWLHTKRGKRIPVDGATIDFNFEQGKHVSHWDTCPDSNQWKDAAKAKQEAIWAERAAAYVVPLPMRERLATIKALSKQLLERGMSVPELQAISQEATGLRKFKHLHCTSQQDLDRLIERLKGMA